MPTDAFVSYVAALIAATVGLIALVMATGGFEDDPPDLPGSSFDL